ncbi:MAG: DUF790 family protein [Planctomycetes bacterium]|nr:DUF790 family protein [Planctomycetota bacterium]
MRCAADAVPAVCVDGEIVPDWLGGADAPWLRELLFAAQAFAGRPVAALRAHWRALEVPPRAGARWPHVLAVVRQRVVAAPPRASRLREAVFAAAAAGSARDAAIAAGAAATGVPAAEVEARLFADLGEQRCVRWPPQLDVDAVRRAVNGRFAQALLGTATAAELELSGASRALLRTAWLHGAHFRCRGSDATGARLSWRAPPADRRAGRRLAAIVPVLGWTRRFELRAECRWRGGRGTLVLTSLDALPVGAPVAPFDSRFEAEVAAALTLELGDWDVLREPAPVPVGERLLFPDFGLVPRGGGAAAWWVEVAGLRDPGALAGKLQLLREVARYVLCVPAGRCPDGWRGHPRIVEFAGRGAARVRQVVVGVGSRVVASG